MDRTGPGTLALEHRAFDEAVAALAERAAELAGERARLDRRVDDLMRGWRGAAADSVAAAWDDWQRGAREVADALAALTRLMDAVHVDLAARDADAAGGLRRLAARLEGPGR